jgi:anti-sigma factor RsiW
MNCSQFDLKALSLGELGGSEKAEAAKHVGACSICREEFERLEATRTALLSLRDEEMPRRIAFVSDRVFEPRWWQRLWRSGPALGFASAAMLSLAILVHAFARPAPVPQPAVAHAAVDTAAVEARISAELEKRLQAAVEKAVAQTEERQSLQYRQALASMKREFEFQQAADRVAFQDELTVLRKRMNVAYHMANADFGGRQ